MSRSANILGKYELLEEIGDGTEGRVYKAVCVETDVPGVRCGELVALKRLKSTGRDKESQQFRRQIEILSKLDHPNIVRYKDSFVWREKEIHEDIYCLVMELLEGETLKEVVKKHPEGIPWPQASTILAQTLQALHYASQNGVIHRDLKPSNINIAPDGTPKLFDFGIARQEDGDMTATSSSAGAKGTPDYMAPDFALEHGGFRGDEQSDIFSFGVIIHQVLTGSLPYPPLGENAIAKYFHRWLKQPPEPDFRKQVFKVVARARSCISKCIDPSRTARFKTFQEVIAEFAQAGYRKLKHGTEAYEFIAWLGKGGFGEVFLARRISDGREVAIKRLYIAGQSARFIREAKILRNAAHKHLTDYVDFVEVKVRGEDSEYYLILEYLAGMPAASLRSRILKSHEGLDTIDALRIFIAYLDCLDHLHNNGIIHRDIKPGNLYAPENHPERAKIFDLGIAHDEGGTRTHGQVPGTLDFMPPEFASPESGRGSARSDIYSIGVTFYQTLTKKLPFPRLPENESEAWAEFIRRSMRPLECTFRQPVFEKHPELVDILRRALTHNPDHRYASAGKMRDDLQTLLTELTRPVVEEPEEVDPEDRPTVAAPTALVEAKDAIEADAEAATAATKLADLPQMERELVKEVSPPEPPPPPDPAELERQRQAAKAAAADKKKHEEAEKLKREQAEKAERERAEQEAARNQKLAEVATATAAADRKKREEAEKLKREQAEKAERERAEREAARQKELAEAAAAAAATDKKKREEAEKLKREQAEKAERERVEREAARQKELAAAAERKRIKGAERAKRRAEQLTQIRKIAVKLAKVGSIVLAIAAIAVGGYYGWNQFRAHQREKTYADLVTAAHQNFTAHYYHAAINKAQQALDYRKSDASMQQLIKDADVQIKLQDDFDRSLKIARDALGQHDYSNAVSCAATALAKKQDDPTALEIQTKAQSMLDAYHAAIKRANAADGAANYDSVTKEASNALAIYPNNADMQRLKAHAEGILRKRATDESAYQAAIQAGRSALEGRDYTKAIDQAGIALGVRPADLDAASLQKQAQEDLQHANETKDKQAAYDQDIQSVKDDLNAKNYQAAVDTAQKALTSDFREAEGSNLLAEAQRSLAQWKIDQSYDAAIMDWNRANDLKDFSAMKKAALAALNIRPNDTVASNLLVKTHNRPPMADVFGVPNLKLMWIQELRQGSGAYVQSAMLSQAQFHALAAKYSVTSDKMQVSGTGDDDPMNLNYQEAINLCKALNGAASSLGLHGIFELPARQDFLAFSGVQNALSLPMAGANPKFESLTNYLLSIGANTRGSGGSQPRSASSGTPNQFGLFNVLGNAWQWCDDESGAGFAYDSTFGSLFRERQMVQGLYTGVRLMFVPE